MTIHYSTSLTQKKIVHSPFFDLQVVLLQSFEPSSLHGNSWEFETPTDHGGSYTSAASSMLPPMTQNLGLASTGFT